MTLDPGTALTSLKAIAKIARDAGNIPLQNEIIDLQLKFMELIAAHHDLMDRERAARGRIRELEEQLGHRQRMQFDLNAYWTSSGPRVSDEHGPFCTNCWDTKEACVHLIPDTDGERAQCPKCRTTVRIWLRTSSSKSWKGGPGDPYVEGQNIDPRPLDRSNWTMEG